MASPAGQLPQGWAAEWCVVFQGKKDFLTVLTIHPTGMQNINDTSLSVKSIPSGDILP
jgi:hypothetical protein